jgi:hypothetical protein
LRSRASRMRWQEHGPIFCTVYGGPLGQARIYEHWTPACAKAGILRYRVHDLRHSVVSRLIAGSYGHPGSGALTRPPLRNYAYDRLRPRGARRSWTRRGAGGARGGYFVGSLEAVLQRRAEIAHCNAKPPAVFFSRVVLSWRQIKEKRGGEGGIRTLEGVAPLAV